MRPNVLAMILPALICASLAAQSPAVTPALAHVMNTFSFELAAPMTKVAPLFAPEAERTWAGADWNPVFCYPQPGRDVQGAVFTIDRASHHSIWVTTLFDLTAGRMQYVAIVPDRSATIIDVHVTAATPTRTNVEVTYSRTALRPEANEQIQAQGKQDLTSGPEWQHGIEAALAITTPK